MVDGDSNARDDVFVYKVGGGTQIYDQLDGATERVSVASTGAQADGASSEPSISGDGRYVAFGSSASNLVSGDTNGAADVFVHDRVTGATTRVSVGGSGAQANNSSGSPSISADGRYVAFGSSASNLVGGDTNAADDIFVRDRSAATTTRVSVGSAGAQANAPSRSAAISGNGGFVAFDSAASNLVGDDTNSAGDAFVRSLGGATTTRVSVTSGGGQANETSSSPSISSDGSRIAFASSAALASGDENGGGDIYVRDRAANQTTWATAWAANQGWTSGGTSSSPAISANGRYVALALHSDVQIDDLNGAYDIYEYDLATGAWKQISRDEVRAGNKASDSPSLSADGKRAAFESSATNFYLDTNGLQDIFVHEWVGAPVTDGAQSQAVTTPDGADDQPGLGPCSVGKPATPTSQSPAQPSSSDSADNQTALLLLQPPSFCLIRPIPPPCLFCFPDDDAEGKPWPVPPPVFPDPPDDEQPGGPVITVYRGVNGKKNADRVFNKPSLSPSSFQLDPDGVSTYRRSTLPPTQPYMVPFHVQLPRPDASEGPVIEIPNCMATYTPQFATGHWSINCIPRDDTDTTLAHRAKTPPIRQWIKCDRNYTLKPGENGCIDDWTG
ncbi:MAG: hypothetical protein WKF94_14405 [Solirubrobacteraceae bacterium]